MPTGKHGQSETGKNNLTETTGWQARQDRQIDMQASNFPTRTNEPSQGMRTAREGGQNTEPGEKDKTDRQRKLGRGDQYIQGQQYKGRQGPCMQVTQMSQIAKRQTNKPEGHGMIDIHMDKEATEQRIRQTDCQKLEGQGKGADIRPTDTDGRPKTGTSIKRRLTYIQIMTDTVGQTGQQRTNGKTETNIRLQRRQRCRRRKIEHRRMR